MTWRWTSSSRHFHRECPLRFHVTFVSLVTFGETARGLVG